MKGKNVIVSAHQPPLTDLDLIFDILDQRPCRSSATSCLFLSKTEDEHEQIDKPSDTITDQLLTKLNNDQQQQQQLTLSRYELKQSEE